LATRIFLIATGT